MASNLQASVATTPAPWKLVVDLIACRREGRTMPMKHSQRLAFLVGRASMELAGVSVILAAPAQAGKRVRFVKAERLVSVT